MSQTYKTIISSEVIDHILEKLILLEHGNIIQIQKIAKSKPKTSSQNRQQTYYSLYYEVVPFSIKNVAMKLRQSDREMPEMGAKELREKLREAAE
mgnify:CR=1 FL=1